MEASEKPQLPLDGGTAESVVRAIDDRLVIERLEVGDEQAARVVRDRAHQGHDPAETVRKLIEIGARVIEGAGAAVNVETINSQFERKMGTLAEQLEKSLDAGSEELAGQLEAVFGADRAGSIQHQTREMLVKFGEHQRTEMLRLFTAGDDANPLADFKSGVVRAVKGAQEAQQLEREEDRKRIEGLTEEIVKLREQNQADVRVAEAEEAGTRKGRSFEERAHEAIERIAAARGDAASHTGGEKAEGGGKKGDTLVELSAAAGPAAGRIVFEAKDSKPLSKNEAWRQLNEGMAARAASFGVLVVAGEQQIPAGREALTEYEGNKLIIGVDRDEPDGLALEVAYRLAAARVAMSRETDLTVDAAAVLDAAEEAISCLKQAQAIRASLTGIKTSSDKARATLDEMVESVRARLERVESLVEAADPE